MNGCCVCVLWKRRSCCYCVGGKSDDNSYSRIDEKWGSVAWLRMAGCCLAKEKEIMFNAFD